MAKTKILFVCMGNCVRSQMAEALARHHFTEEIECESAGLRPLGFIDPTARTVIEECGMSMDGQYSKGLHDHTLGKPDLIVNMSGVPGPKHFQGHNVEDWIVADPFGEDLDLHRRIRDDIDSRLKDLIARLGTACGKEKSDAAGS
jgi:arsenate reductase